MIYRIEIVDSPDFNAFAVPGGFVYVNRGLLERMNSSDELASVLGHEIKRGDTWESITGKYFGSSTEMNKLADFNGYEAPLDLTVGDLLKIPPTLHIRCPPRQRVKKLDKKV